MDKKEELQDYFNTLATKPYINQLQVHGLIKNAAVERDRFNLVRELVARGERGVTIETTFELDENNYVVVKSTQFKDYPGFAVEMVNLEAKTTTKTHEYYHTKEQALIAGLIKHLGGSDSIITAVELMIKGSKK